MNTLNFREMAGANGLSATQANMTPPHALDHIRQSFNGSTDRTARAGIEQFLTPAAIAQFMASLFEGGPGHGKGSAVDSPMEISDWGHGTHGFTEWLAAYHGKWLQLPQRPSYYPEPTFIHWRVREVFQGEVRYGGSP